MRDPFDVAMPAIADDRLSQIGSRFGLTGPPAHLGGERDQNVVMDGPAGACVLKVANVAEHAAVLRMQADVLDHLQAVAPHLPVPRVRRTPDGDAVVEVDVQGSTHAVRVATYLDGLPSDTPASAPFRRATGDMLGRLQVALAGFFHPEAGRSLLWDARRAVDARPWLPELRAGDTRSLVDATLARFAEFVHPRLAGLPAQVIHNDFHAGNLLTDATGDRIVGVIDFGDVIHATRVQDVAVAVAYGIQGTSDPLRAALDILGPYLDHVPLDRGEIAVLPDLVALRFAQSLLINAHRATLYPGNAKYLLADTMGMQDGLTRWAALAESEVLGAFSDLAGHPGATRPRREVLAARAQVLSPMLETSYATPLHLVRGEGVWLVDADGRRYLDAYNNVVQVGHANPRVVRAITGQAGRLNTNTRYLTDGVVEYAESLEALLPGDLGVCFFVNSGTEANDLAWRMATAVSGNTGVVVTDFAYHGWTDAVMEMSPEEHEGRPLAPWVAAIPPPKPGANVTMSVARAIGRLSSGGHRPAAALIDSAFSSDGIHDLTPGYLSAVAEAVRAHGGVLIADEVQAGMGRVGERFWGFAGDTVVPDIVTLGKPIGNGFPMGAVITTPDVAALFARHSYFFSTFGGNPVAAAAGMAVLDITLEEGLAAKADVVGDLLRDDIGAVLMQHNRTAAIRGSGLFVGVDLQDAGLAELIVEGMKDRGVLISRTGPGRDVLKIRPPLVFGEQHAILLVQALDDVLDGAP